MRARFASAELPVTNQTATTCCYAKSDKTWTVDPQGVAWETFQTLEHAPVYGESRDRSREARVLQMPAAPAQISIGARRNDKTYNILVLCTGNSARSIMAEALFNTLGKGRFHAFSAGSHPSGAVNPFAIERCESLDYDTAGLRSKSWDEFGAPDAPQMDFVITVCDQAAGEVCPIWPGKPITAHWGFEDPAAFVGSDEEKRAVFTKVYRQILTRVSQFVNLPLHVLDRNAAQNEVRAIGERPAEESNGQH